MKSIAVISADELLRRVVAIAVECARRDVDVVEADAIDDELLRCGYDAVVILGAAPIVSGRLSLGGSEILDAGRTKLYVISWQHGENTVMGLLECGVSQYMTFPLNIDRLIVKIASCV